MQNNRIRSVLKRYWPTITLIFLIIIGLIIIIFATRGKLTTTGNYPANTKTGSIVCTKDDVAYPYTGVVNPDIMKGSSIRIVGAFSEDKTIEKISLDYTTYYASKEIAINNEAYMHGELGKKLSTDGLSYSLFENKFSNIDNRVIMTFYAPAEEIDRSNYLYLLFSTYPKNDEGTIRLDALEENFTKKNYKCVSTD